MAIKLHSKPSRTERNLKINDAEKGKKMGKEDCKCPFGYTEAREHIDLHYDDKEGFGCIFAAQKSQLKAEKADWVKCAEQQGRDLRRYAAENERLRKKNERLADAVERLQRSKTS